MKWAVDQGERRTFITTPYHFRIELQTNKDVVDSMNHPVRIQELTLETKKLGLENDLAMLFGHCVNHISSVVGSAVTIKEAEIKGLLSSYLVDPNGVKILN